MAHSPQRFAPVPRAAIAIARVDPALGDLKRGRSEEDGSFVIKGLRPGPFRMTMDLGARRVGDAERAFGRLAATALRHLRHPVVSYGLLVDDLHVYRAIVARRPIGLEHPQSRAARALRDVARLLLDDARRHSIG